MGKVVVGGAALFGLPAVGMFALVVLVLAASSAPSSAGACGFGDGDTGTSIMGEPTLSAEQMASWYASSGYADPASTIGVSTEELTELYAVIGEAEGVRPEVALVQATVETGGFTNQDSRFLNNFAGIGHCDTCAQGMRFESVPKGVLAQVQLLKKVAMGNDVVMELEDLSPRWNGVQAVDLDGLTQNWASSPIYAATLASTLGGLLSSAGESLSSGGGSACVVSGDVAFPLLIDSIDTETWLTKPHHDHASADIPVPAGTEVFSPVSGTVTAAPVGADCGLGGHDRGRRGERVDVVSRFRWRRPGRGR